jgi:hypothetical protein
MTNDESSPKLEIRNPKQSLGVAGADIGHNGTGAAWDGDTGNA